jgi:ATP-dependent DNA helicase RecG
MNQRLIDIVDALRAHDSELEWFEFKENQFNPEVIGKLISAISNSARINDQHTGYIIWGVRNSDHAVIGTSISPLREKHRGQPYQFWLEQNLSPAPSIKFNSVSHPGGRVVILEIPAATQSPVMFDGTAYIRIQDATPPLYKHPERQKLLWSKLQPYAWETSYAAEYQTSDDVLSNIDYPAYFDLIRQPLPDNKEGILEKLASEKFIVKDIVSKWNITNMGAILFAKNLSYFDNIKRKAIRVTQYEGVDRTTTVKHRRDGSLGYANSFVRLIEYLNNIIPSREEIGIALRQEESVYPEIAIRETVANALIHQDMTVTGTGPTIDIFQNRIEITNPGSPLVPVERFIDYPPRSRNESLASLMRRMRICEEQGSGFDKVVTAIEMHELPPIDFRSEDNFTRTILFAKRPYSHFTPEERLRACYQHAVIRYIRNERLTNASLRARFGIEDNNASMISRLINEAVEKKQIKVADSSAPKSGYIPFWA